MTTGNYLVQYPDKTYGIAYHDGLDWGILASKPDPIKWTLISKITDWEDAKQTLEREEK